MDLRVIHDFLNPFIIPTCGSSRVLVKEVAAIVQLHSRNATHKVEMHHCLLSQCLDPQWVHISVMHTLIP